MWLVHYIHIKDLCNKRSKYKFLIDTAVKESFFWARSFQWINQTGLNDLFMNQFVPVLRVKGIVHPKMKIVINDVVPIRKTFIHLRNTN